VPACIVAVTPPEDTLTVWELPDVVVTAGVVVVAVLDTVGLVAVEGVDVDCVVVELVEEPPQPASANTSAVSPVVSP
jgi:hypothetical protein